MHKFWIIFLVLMAACSDAALDKPMDSRKRTGTPTKIESLTDEKTKDSSKNSGKSPDAQDPDPVQKIVEPEPMQFEFKILDGNSEIAEIVDTYSAGAGSYRKELAIEILKRAELDRFEVTIASTDNRVQLTTNCKSDLADQDKCQITIEINNAGDQPYDFTLRAHGYYKELEQLKEIPFKVRPKTQCAKKVGFPNTGILRHDSQGRRFNAAQAVAADGSLFVVSIAQRAATELGRLLIEKFDCSGARAANFGENGIATVNLPFGRPILDGSGRVAIDELPRVNVKATGQILIDVLSFDVNADRRRVYRGISVIQFGSNGQLDNAFGTNGISIVRNGLPVGQGDRLISALASISSTLDQTGRLVIAIGDVLNGTGSTVIRLTNSGAADPTFATGGVYASYAPSNQDTADRAIELAVDKFNNVYFMTNQFAQAVDNSRARFFRTRIKKLTNAGAIDQSWGRNGQVDLNECVAADQINGFRMTGRNMISRNDSLFVTCQSIRDPGDPSIVSPSQLQVIKLELNGNLAASFGNGGRARFVTRAGTDPVTQPVKSEVIGGIAVDQQGRVLGLSLIQRGFTERDTRAFRLTNDGKLDASFGTAGTMNFGNINAASRAGVDMSVDGTAVVFATGTGDDPGFSASTSVSWYFDSTGQIAKGQ